MRIVLILIFSAIVSFGFSQATPGPYVRVATTTTDFGINLPIGALVYEATGDDLYMLPSGATSAQDLVAISDEILVNSGSGNVTKVGTPVDNQVGVWTGDGTIEGDVDLTFDGVTLSSDRLLVTDAGSTTVESAEFTGAVQIGTYSQTARDAGTVWYNGGHFYGWDGASALQLDGGGGGVSVSGTPVDNQLAVWTNSSTIEGTNELTYDGSGYLELNWTGGNPATIAEFRLFADATSSSQIWLVEESGASDSWMVSGDWGNVYSKGASSFVITNGISSPFVIEWDGGGLTDDALVIKSDGGIVMEDLLSDGSQSNMIYYNTSTKELSYGAKPSGSGDVTKVGTPVDNQVGVWTGNGTIEGDADLTFDGNKLTAKQLYISTPTAGAGDYDNFLVLDVTGTEVKTRSGSDVVSDIGAVDYSGTPANTYIPYFTDVNTVASESAFTYNSSTDIQTVSSIGLGKEIEIDPTPASNSWAGTVATQTAGETVAAGDLCYFKSDGKMWKADADAEASIVGLCIATAAITANNTGKFLLNGYINISTYSFTAGAIIYASQTTGPPTSTKPTATGSYVVMCGQAEGTTIIRFDPKFGWVKN